MLFRKFDSKISVRYVSRHSQAWNSAPASDLVNSYRVCGGGGPEDAPGAGGHHEAGEVGHGECEIH